MEKIKTLNKTFSLKNLNVSYLIDIMTAYKLRHKSGKPTGLMGATYMKLGNKDLDIVSFLKSDKYKGKMLLNCIIDHKQEVAVTYVPPTKLTRTEIEFAIGYSRTDKEAENKAREFRKAINNGIKFYRYRNS